MTVEGHDRPDETDVPWTDHVWARLTPQVWRAIAESAVYESAIFDIDRRPLTQPEVEHLMTLGPKCFRELLSFALAGDDGD